jgi:peptidyl-prolyl cis-trans isomerase SurA
MLSYLYRIIFFLAVCCYSTFAAAEERLLDQVVAIVNSQVITQSQLNQQMRMDKSTSRQAALDQLINIALQKDIAKKAHITVSEADVDTTIDKIASQNHLSRVQLQKSVAAQGISESAYLRQIHDQILLHQVQQAFVAPKVKVTPQDIANARNQAAPAVVPVFHDKANAKYHVIDIFVSSRETAEKLLKKIRGGGNPEKILNNNPHVKIADLGFRPLSQLPDVFVKPVKSLNPGQFSDPIKAPNGIHIVTIMGVEGRAQNALPAPVLTPEQMAFQQKFEEALQQWLHNLRSQSYVKIVS